MVVGGRGWGVCRRASRCTLARDVFDLKGDVGAVFFRKGFAFQGTTSWWGEGDGRVGRGGGGAFFLLSLKRSAVDLSGRPGLPRRGEGAAAHLPSPPSAPLPPWPAGAGPGDGREGPGRRTEWREDEETDVRLSL